MEKKLLFVCKKKNDHYGISYGLVNSCNFVVNALKKLGIQGKVVQVVDGNFIDREIHQYKPTHVFTEAIWVTPAKFHELINIPRYKHIKWYVRSHSKVPFLSNEGIAIEWNRKYVELTKTYNNFYLSANNHDIITAFKQAYNVSMLYFPNIYCPPEYVFDDIEPRDKEFFHIGCFGAIRPMKNQLYQALAAISFGNKIGKRIAFHINSSRVEQKGDPILKNIEEAFINTPHELVKHPWMGHYDFIKVVKTMDIGMQVSLTESFNIVAADFVSNNVPIVGSKDIEWLNFIYKASPTKFSNIILRLWLAYYGKCFSLQTLNEWGLRKYNYKAIKCWLDKL